MNLYNIFGGVLERALELYEQGRITCIYASENAGVASHSDRNNARYLVQVKGLSGAIYTLFPDINYCTCASFRYKVLKISKITYDNKEHCYEIFYFQVSSVKQ